MTGFRTHFFALTIWILIVYEQKRAVGFHLPTISSRVNPQIPARIKSQGQLRHGFRITNHFSGLQSSEEGNETATALISKLKSRVHSFIESSFLNRGSSDKMEASVSKDPIRNASSVDFAATSAAFGSFNDTAEKGSSSSSAERKSDDEGFGRRILDRLMRYGKMVGKKSEDFAKSTEKFDFALIPESANITEGTDNSRLSRRDIFTFHTPPTQSGPAAKYAADFKQSLSKVGKTLTSYLPEIIIVWPGEKEKMEKGQETREVKPTEAERVEGMLVDSKKEVVEVISSEDQKRLPPEIKFDIVDPGTDVHRSESEKNQNKKSESKNTLNGLGEMMFLLGDIFLSSSPVSKNLTAQHPPQNQSAPRVSTAQMLADNVVAEKEPPQQAQPSFFQALSSFGSLFSQSNRTTKSHSTVSSTNTTSRQLPHHPPQLPVPHLSGLQSLSHYKISLAIYAALHIHNEKDGEEFMKYIGLDPLIEGILCKERFHDFYTPTDAVKGLCLLMKAHPPVTDRLMANKELKEEIVNKLCDLMEAPIRLRKKKQREKKNFLTSFFRSIARVNGVPADEEAERKAEEQALRGQHEAISVVHRLIRTSDLAVEELRKNPRLKRVLMTIEAEPDFEDDLKKSGLTELTKSSDSSIMHEMKHENMTATSPNTSSVKRVLVEPIQLSYEDTSSSKSYLVRNTNQTTFVEYVNLKPSQMARVSLWGMGGVPWKPLQPTQKGLRILSFDGGGTRGVLSIAILREIFDRLSQSIGQRVQPLDYFDMICGTSTGGIIALLLGSHKNSVEEAEQLYDEFIERIFATKSHLNLFKNKAYYDEKEFEKILYQMCGDQLLLDSNQLKKCPRLFVLSSKYNVNPLQTQIWRNYNYPLGMKSRNAGTFRVNTLTAVRATTAAPTYFTPVPWEGGLYIDGALAANNPTAIAIEEAKTLFPEVPVELVVSIGTGIYIDSNQKAGGTHNFGWDYLVNQLVATSTGTEDTHHLLSNFLSKDVYHRFNPILPDSTAIDEKNPKVLLKLKKLGKEYAEELLEGNEAKNGEGVSLLDVLKGEKRKK